jgi:hypothetical protein
MTSRVYHQGRNLVDIEKIMFAVTACRMTDHEKVALRRSKMGNPMGTKSQINQKL